MIKFFGDVHFDRQKKVDISLDCPFVVNYEHVYYDSEHPHELNKVLVKSKRRITDAFETLPYAVSLANNHIFDFAEQGFLNTVEMLKKNNVKFFGAGTELDNYNNPCILDVEGKKIALLGYCALKGKFNAGDYSVAMFSEQKYLSDLRTCRELNADRIIVSIHWGNEESPVNTSKQRKTGRFLIDNGCDLVIGHHPHCIQPVEIYKGKYIFYSLGNMMFDNLCANAFYEDEETYLCKYAKRQLRWNKLSAMVTYDERTGSVEGVSRIRHKKDRIYVDIGETAKTLKWMNNTRFASFRTIYRKIISTVAKSFFFEGKIVNIMLIRQIVKMFVDMHITKRKDKQYE